MISLGLNKKEVLGIEHYSHFRNVQLAEKKVLLDKNESIFHTDILDGIKDDLPKGAWSIQIDISGLVARIRSLLWNGYIAYHVATTNNFGGVYLGTGLKNKDLAFMI